MATPKALSFLNTDEQVKLPVGGEFVWLHCTVDGPRPVGILHRDRRGKHPR